MFLIFRFSVKILCFFPILCEILLLRMCAYMDIRASALYALCMAPTSQLFAIDVAGISPPQRVLKLSRRSLQRLIMPPKVVGVRGGHRGSVAVGPTHPAKVAKAKKNAAAGGDAAVIPRTSPPKAAPRQLLAQ